MALDTIIHAWLMMHADKEGKRGDFDLFLILTCSYRRASECIGGSKSLLS
jgi:hypothetical protein